MSFEEKEYSLAEFEPVRKEVLDSFFSSIENEAIRHFGLNLFNATEAQDHETYFGLLRFMCLLGRPMGHDQGKLSELAILQSLERVNTQKITRFKLGPLHLAAIMGYSDLAQALVEAARSSSMDTVSAVLNTTDEYGNTPLHFAVAFQHKDLCQYLIAQGADKTQKNSLDGSPEDMAGRFYIQSFLQDESAPEKPVSIWVKTKETDELVLVDELPAQNALELPVRIRALSAMSWRAFNALYLCGLRKTQTHMSPKLHQEFQEAFEWSMNNVVDQVFLAPATYDNGSVFAGGANWGLYAKQDVKAGTIIPYGGMLRLASFMSSGDRNFLLATAQHPVLKKCAYEGMVHSHFGTYVNHSFPNCAFVHGFWKGTIELGIMVTEPVKAGEQFTVSYGLAADQKAQFIELRPQARKRFIEESYQARLQDTITLLGAGEANNMSWLEHCRVIGNTAKFLYLHGRKLSHGEEDFEANPRFMELVQTP